MKYHFKIHKEGKGFWAECLELEGCITQGKTLNKVDPKVQTIFPLKKVMLRSVIKDFKIPFSV